MSHRPVSKRASSGMPNLSWDKERHRVCKWLKGKDIGAQSNTTQRNSLEEVRRIIIHNGVRSSTHQDVTHFERSQADPEQMVEYGADTSKKNIFTYLQNLHISTSLEKKLLTGCLRPPGTCQHRQNQSRRKGGGQRMASCANVSLQRAQETRWQQKTGAEGRSVRPRRRESWSR